MPHLGKKVIDPIPSLLEILQKKICVYLKIFSIAVLNFRYVLIMLL